MANSERIAKCGGCGRVVPDDTASKGGRIPCPDCRSTSRSMEMEEVAHTTLLADGHRVRGVRKNLTGGRKDLFDLTGGHEISRSLGRPVRKTRVIDHRKNQYIERVEDPKSGEVLRDVSEPLKQHTGRGSAKQKRPKEEK